MSVKGNDFSNPIWRERKAHDSLIRVMNAALPWNNPTTLTRMPLDSKNTNLTSDANKYLNEITRGAYQMLHIMMIEYMENTRYSMVVRPSNHHAVPPPPVTT